MSKKGEKVLVQLGHATFQGTIEEINEDGTCDISETDGTVHSLNTAHILAVLSQPTEESTE